VTACVCALLHPLRQRSSLAPLDKIVEKWLAVLCIGLQQNLVHSQHTINVYLIFRQAIMMQSRHCEAVPICAALFPVSCLLTPRIMRS
jgi:hypothetical protein